MGKKASKTLIGAFVLGAIALVVASVVIFGGGKFFERTYQYVMFFDGSVKGLSIGAPVILRGAKIGSVTGMDVIFNPATLKVDIPVFIELQPEKIKGTVRFRRDPKAIQGAIDRGLRAQLELQSFVTGQLMVNLDFHPDKPARYVGIVKKYQEIPTIPTTLEELSATLRELPIKSIVSKLEKTLDGIQSIVNAPEAKESVVSLNNALKDTRQLVQHLNNKIDPVVESLTGTSTAARDAFVQAKDTMYALKGDTRELISTAEDTLRSAEQTLKQAKMTLGAFSEDSRLLYELNTTLREVSAASRSIRNLADDLDRQPEALIKGRGGKKGD